MSTPLDPRERYPATLRHSTAQSGLVYERSGDMFARLQPNQTHASDAGVAPGVASSASPQDLMVRKEALEPDRAQLAFSVTGDDGARIDVYRGTPDAAPSGRGVRPVYVERLSQRAVVPSGRALVRFVEGVEAAARSSQLQAAGYRIVEVLGYAPHCAWVEAADGDPAASLRDIAMLERLADVVNVEPQWLAPRGTR